MELCVCITDYDDIQKCAFKVLWQTVILCGEVGASETTSNEYTRQKKKIALLTRRKVENSVRIQRKLLLQPHTLQSPTPDMRRTSHFVS